MKEEGIEVSRGGVKTPELPGISYLKVCLSAKILNTQFFKGINKIKFALKGSTVQKQAVQDCEDEGCEAARQEVYSANWPAIMEMIRTSNKRPDVIIRGQLIILWSLH